MPTPTPSPSTEYGSPWRLQFGDGQPTEAFVSIAGETTFDWDRTAKEIDESSKDDAELAATGAGAAKIAFSASGKLKLPDPGISRANTVFKTSPRKCMMKIMKGGIVKFHGQVAIASLKTSHPNDDVCTWSLSTTACAVPLIDDLGASA